NLVGFRQHGDRDCGRVHSPLLLGLRNTLDTVHAALVFELAIDAMPADQGYYLFHSSHGRIAGGGDLDLPAPRLSEAPIHTEDFVGEQGRLVAARAGADLQ